MDKAQIEGLAKTLRIACNQALVTKQELEALHGAFIAYDSADTAWSVGLLSGRWNQTRNGSWVPGDPPLELYIEDSIRARIDSLGAQLRTKETPAAGATNACPQCGYPVAVGKKFCTTCGTTVTQSRVEVPEAPPTERRCPDPECGSPVPLGKKFCTSCGTPIA